MRSTLETVQSRGVGTLEHLSVKAISAAEIAKVPKTQALNTKTFKIPPLDGSLLVPDLWDWHLENSPNHPVFIYTKEDGTEKTLRWSDLVPSIHAAGWIVRSRLPTDIADSRPVVAVIAASDTITYFLVESGIIRANCIFFPISPRNSPAAVAHLLKATNASHVILGLEPNLKHLAASAFSLMEADGVQIPQSSDMPALDDMLKPETHCELLPRVEASLYDTLYILHSSGSTAFPKPIRVPHRALFSAALAPFYSTEDFCGLRIGFHSVPLYHGMGTLALFWTITCGPTICVFRPQSPAIVPTPEKVLEAIQDNSCHYSFCVPTFVETWAADPRNVQVLKQLRGVISGGAPLSKQVGDRLAGEGVPILTNYGCSEVGPMNQIIRENPGKDWQYMNFDIPSVRTHWIHHTDGTAELVILPSPVVTPYVYNTVINGENAYATNDLFIPHLTKPGYWRVYGRADDQIVHSTGEKTNPGPLELILKSDPHVESCVMFGRNRFNAGVLVAPKAAFVFGPSDSEKLAAYRNTIWPTVEKMNEFAPQHSRIFKEMILITSPSKPFTFTAKNTPRRQAILKEYEPEIEALYTTVSKTTQVDGVAPPNTWDLGTTTAFVREVVGRVIKSALADTDDMFQKGCDSLQTTWIRNTILRAVQESPGAENAVRRIPGSFVYQHPTIASLSRYIYSLCNAEKPASNTQTNGHNEDQEPIAAMLDMAHKYCGDWREHKPTVNITKSETVLVTGTTGSLGSGLLAALVQEQTVEHVFALNRPGDSNKSLFDRQQGRLVERGYDPDILRSPKVTLIETDMSAGNLGLSEEVYRKIRASVTHIIHNAYPVNFNLSLSSFEPSIRTMRHLIDLALSSPHASPPRLLFVSSIGVLKAPKGDKPVPEEPTEPSTAVSSGYTQSKWVGEHLLSTAGKETSLRPIVVRLGQVAGSPSGAWNRDEWLPAMIKSSRYMGCLPSFQDNVSWIPLDAAARSLVQMRNSPYPFLHLAHPRPVPWSTILSPISAALDLPVVSFNEWVARLEQSEQGTSGGTADTKESNPALRILSFFSLAREQSGPKRSMGLPELETRKAQSVAPALGSQNLPQLNEQDALKWLAYWMKVAIKR